MNRQIVIAHDEDDAALATQVARPLQDAGYEPLHLGTVLVGESLTEQASNLLAAGAPVVICATRLAMGSEWPKRLAFAARQRTPSLLFVAHMEAKADVKAVALDDTVARWHVDAALAARQLVAALQTHCPITAPAARAAVEETLNDAQEQLYKHLLEQGPPPPPETLRELALNAKAVRGLKGYLLHRHAHWLHRGVTQAFVNLDLITDHGPQSPEQRYTPKRCHSLPELLAQAVDAGGWLLKGSPGCGKSTLLQHHEFTQAEAALRALHVGQVPVEICIWQRLSEYTPGSAAPREWLTQRFTALYPNWPAAAQPERLGRVRYLLDGLNELPSVDGTPRSEVVQRFSLWAFGQQALMAAPVFSVREQDLSYSLARPADHFKVQQASLQAWSAQQVMAYCALRLGESNALWPVLEGDATLLAFSRLPLNLAAQCELYESLGRAARHRAELFSGLAWLRLRREHGQGRLNAPGLLPAHDARQLLDETHWRSHLLALPARGGLVRGLDAQGLAMQRLGAAVSVDEDQVRLDANNPAGLPEWLQAAKDLGIAETELSGQFRFSHQLWQEFFAARALSKADQPLPDVGPPALEDLAQVKAGMGLLDPLPGPGVSPWEETIKMAAQLVGQTAPSPDALLRSVMAVNLPLAARAALGCLAHITPELLAQLQTRLLERSRDPATDVRLRIEAARALGELGDPRYEGPQTGARYRWPNAKHWVRIEAGTYTIGSLDGNADERPLTPVPLQAFEMAFAPVTNAEYQCFVNAGGYQDQQWWVGEQARKWLRKGLAMESEMAWWRPRLQALRERGEAAFVEDLFTGLTPTVKKSLEPCIDWSNDDTKRWLDNEFSAKPATEPLFAHDNRYNHPAQPVVGICAIEAEAYCRWLSAHTCRDVRLPTEAEWEAAARGHEARSWPWGHADITPERANHEDTRLRCASPVAVFPAGDAPGPLCDMAGNVWDWTASPYNAKGHDLAALIGQAVDVALPRALRGGGWNLTAPRCRAAYRDRITVGGRNDTLGLRLVRAAPSNPEP